MAVQNGHVDVVKELVAAGVDVNIAKKVASLL